MSFQAPIASMICFLIASVLGAVGQFLYKAAAEHAEGGMLSTLLTWRAAGGMACYVAVMVLFLVAFKKGGAVSVLYPIYALTFVWAAIIGRMAYGEAIHPINVAGMAALAVGMCLMGLRAP